MSGTTEIAEGLVAAHVIAVLNCDNGTALAAAAATAPPEFSGVTSNDVFYWCRAAVQSANEALAQANAGP